MSFGFENISMHFVNNFDRYETSDVWKQVELHYSFLSCLSFSAIIDLIFTLSLALLIYLEQDYYETFRSLGQAWNLGQVWKLDYIADILALKCWKVHIRPYPCHSPFVSSYCNQLGVHPSVDMTLLSPKLQHPLNYIGRIVREVEKACRWQEPQL